MRPFLIFIILVSFLPPTSPTASSPPSPSPLAHPAVSKHLPRSFSFCTGAVSLNNEPISNLLIPPDSPSALSSSSSPAEVMAYVNSLTPEPLLQAEYDARAFSAFVDDRTSVVLFKRLSFKRAIAASRSPAKIYLTSQSCDGVPSASALTDSWMASDLSLFNAHSSADWDFFFSSSSVSHVLVSHNVFRQKLMCADARDQREYLASVLSNAAEHFVSGGEGRIIFEVYPLTEGEAYPFVEQQGQPDCANPYSSAESLQQLLMSLSTLLVPVSESYADPTLRAYPVGQLLSFALQTSAPPLPPPPPLETFVINLDRRPDRYLQMQAKMDVGGFPAGTVSRVAASDGNTFDLADDEQLAQLFSLTDWRYGGSPFNPYQDHSYRSNVLGCAHSHLRVWDTIAARGDAYREEFGLSNGDTNYGDGAVAYLVLEDDVEFIGENIYEKLTALAGRLRRNSEWDILYLGLLDEEHEGLYGDAVVGGVEGVVKLSKEPRWSGAGAFGMLVRPRAAKKMLELASERGIMQPIDWWIMGLVGSGDLVAYKCSPGLATSPQGAGRDSDNDQVYSQARLVMLGQTDSSPTDLIDEISFMTPSDGACYAAGEGVDVRLNVVVRDDAPVFVEKSRGGKICFGLEGAAGGGGEVEVLTSVKRKRIELGGGGRVDALCIGWDEGGVRLEGLANGAYVLYGEIEGGGWNSAFRVGDCA